MLKKIMIVTFTLLVFAFQAQVFAQTPADTVDVPSTDDQGYVGALARFILGDTTETGERNNINRVYRLKRGDVYLMDGKTYFDFPVKIIADDDPTTRPPIIAPFPLEDGSIPRITFYFYDDAYLKNIYFLGIAPNGQRASWDRPIIIADDAKVTLEHIITDGFRAAGIANIGENSSLFAKDCIWRNVFDSRQFGGQFFFNYGSFMDTISVVNCTVFFGSSYFLCNAREYANYVRFEHNTLFINKINPFYTPYLSNADIKNNLFFAPASAGETPSEREGGWYDWDNERMSVFSIDTIPSDMASQHGITESERRIDFSNNVYFFPQKMKDYWNSIDTLDAPVWMNDRTLAMFNDDTNYPNLNQANNFEADPGFNAEIMTLVDSLYDYIKALREGGELRIYYYKPDGSWEFPGVWPLPEDLAYTNTALMTAGSDGFPVGDLNWFPDKKAEWEELQTAIDDNNATVVKEFTLQQNYPNPFNPTTTIKFSLNKSGYIKLAVYDVVGREIKTLVEGKKTAGKYEVTWNATDNRGERVASGLYFYRLESKNYKQTKKMLIIK
ncbi:T9SS type A sorting domain-containing protein [Calditrichota bacterium LG25]